MKHLILFLLLIAFVDASAQVVQSRRFEKVQKSNDDDFTLISLEEEGIALFRETDKYKGGKHSWQLILLDTALQQKKDTLLVIEREYDIIGYEYLQGKLHFLFQAGEFTKDKIKFVTFDLKDHSSKTSDIKTELDLKLTHFSCIENKMLFGGYISNEPTIVMCSLSDQKVQVVPGFLQRNTQLLDLRVNENNTFNVVMAEKISGETKRIIFRTFDLQGNLLLDDMIEIENNKSILTAISSSLQREDLLILGTWGNRTSNRAYGFYTSLINPFENQKISLTQFGQLNHYLDYLKPRRAEKIKAKTKAAIELGKVYDFSNNVLPYRIIEHEKGYLVLAETYSPLDINRPDPRYNQNTPQSWNNPYYYNPYYYGYPTSRLYRPISYDPNVANENQIKTYSSSLLIINSKGEIEQDHSIKIDEKKIPSVSQVTDINYHQGNVVIVYRKDSKLFYKKIISLSEHVEAGEVDIKLNDSFDELRNEYDYDTGIRSWYQDVFYTWGLQTIRNNNLKDNRIREVFYINKVSIH